MTGDAPDPHIPRGIGWEVKHGHLVVWCKTCYRRWKGDRIGEDANQQYLYDHVQDHRAVAHRTSLPPDNTSDE